MQMLRNFAGNQKPAYRSVMKILIPKEKPGGDQNNAPRWTYSFISANWYTWPRA